MRVIPFSKARSNLKRVIEQVIEDGSYAVIARRGAPGAVLMSLDAFNSMTETLHLLKSPANATHLARSIAQLRKGNQNVVAA